MRIGKTTHLPQAMLTSQWSPHSKLDYEVLESGCCGMARSFEGLYRRKMLPSYGAIPMPPAGAWQKTGEDTVCSSASVHWRHWPLSGFWIQPNILCRCRDLRHNRYRSVFAGTQVRETKEPAAARLKGILRCSDTSLELESSGCCRSRRAFFGQFRR